MSEQSNSRRLVALINPRNQISETGIRNALGQIPPNVDLRSFSDAPPQSIFPEVEGIITNSWLPKPAQFPRLAWVQTLNAGHDDLPDELLSDPKIDVCHGSGPAAVPIAEWTLASMLFFAHRFRRILSHEENRTWHHDRAAEMSASVLHGKKIGILGYGAIGRQVARLCQIFKMEILATLGREGRRQQPTYRTPGTGDPDGNLPDEWVTWKNLYGELSKLDFIVLALRLDGHTGYLVNDDFLRHCNSQAILLNVARGGLVDQDALATALKRRQIGGAALDVFVTDPLPEDDPLRDSPNLLISPHCSPESSFFQEQIASMVAENLRLFGAHKRLLNIILPRVL